MALPSEADHVRISEDFAYPSQRFAGIEPCWLALMEEVWQFPGRVRSAETVSAAGTTYLQTQASEESAVLAAARAAVEAHASP